MCILESRLKTCRRKYRKLKEIIEDRLLLDIAVTVNTHVLQKYSVT